MKFSFGIIEIVLSVAIIFIAMFSMAQASIIFFRFTSISDPPQQAAFLAKEGIEVIRFLRDQSWSNYVATSSVITGTVYYPVASGSAWQLSSSNPGLLLGRFTRELVLSSVNRDASGNIVVSGGSPDASTRKVTVTVTWINEKGLPQTYILGAYITNFLNN